MCSNNIMYYYSWFVVNIILTILRLISLYYMARGQNYLAKKEVDKEKFELLCNAAGCLQEGQSLLIKGRTNTDEER